MKIGIIDNSFFSLQAHSAAVGHDTYVYVEGCPPLPEDVFPAVEKHASNITQVNDTRDFFDDGWSVIVVNEWKTDLYSELCLWHEMRGTGTVILGGTEKARALETNREVGRLLIEKLALRDEGVRVRVAKQRVFTDRVDAAAYVTKNPKCVVKVAPNSPDQDAPGYATVVITTKAQKEAVLAELANKTNRWFADDVGGCVIEEYVVGEEIAFTAFFNGDKFVLPYIANVEQKDAQDDNRTSIFTGEVGSTFEPCYDNGEDGNCVPQLFTMLAEYLQGEFCGMVDMNFLYNRVKRELVFMEFTIRFGRPTLETMMSMVTHGSWLRQVQEAVVQGKNFKYRPQIGVAVTAYHYGYPLLQQVADADALKASLVAPKFQLPKGKNADAQPFFAMYTGKAWEGQVADGRYFTVTGWGDTAPLASKAAYGLYEQFAKERVPGITWRTDITGSQHADVMHRLEQDGFITRNWKDEQ